MEEARESGSAPGDSEPDDDEKDEHEADWVVAYDELETNESVEQDDARLAEVGLRECGGWTWLSLLSRCRASDLANSVVRPRNLQGRASRCVQFVQLGRS